MEFTLDIQGDFDVDKKQFKKLNKAIKVGILQETLNRYDEDGEPITNNEIAALNEMEFGYVNPEGIFVPSRSTIRLPIEMTQDEIIEAGLNAVDSFDEQGIQKGLEAMGNMALYAIDVGFSTGGFGQWKPNSPYTLSKKNGDKPMIDRGNLRKAYSWEVDE